MAKEESSAKHTEKQQLPRNDGQKLDVPALETWLWGRSLSDTGAARCSEVQGLHPAADFFEAVIRCL